MPHHRRHSPLSRSRSRNKYCNASPRKHRHVERSSTSRRHHRNKNKYESRKRRRSPSSSSESQSSSSSSSSSGSRSESSSAYRRHRVSHFKFRRGDLLGYKYRVKKLLGDGTFGRVVQCEYHGRKYAVKIIKPVEKYINSAKTERSIIKKINEKDPDDDKGIVQYRESFYHRNHFCLVFKTLGKSLYDFIKMNNHRGFPIRMVQSFFFQILKSVGFLHHIGYTHTDLKPENILLESPDYREVSERENPHSEKYYLPTDTKIRIIDFGGATKDTEHHSSIINTRQYRSPEVILQCKEWDELSDVWSIGCIICELVTGELFFPTHSDEEHLAMIEKNCGRFPPWMIENIPREESSLQRLFSHGRVDDRRVEHIENVIGLKNLDQILPDQPLLVDLLRKCLCIDPGHRISCRQALTHPFFQHPL